MAEIIRMPKMSDTMTEGVVVAWHKKVGDTVKVGDILAEVETDKATMELENYVKGVLLHIGIEQGQAVPVDALIAIVGKEGEDVSALLSGGSAAPVGDAKAPVAPEVSTAQPEAAAPESAEVVTGEGQRIKASPLARKLAAEQGLDLSRIQGSGDNGRIIRRDLQGAPSASAHAVTPSAPDLSAWLNRPAGQGESFTDQPLSQMRKTIARRLTESKNAAPHFYLTMEIDMDQAVEARQRLNQNAPVKISVNDLVIKAAAMALRQHPAVNSSWLGDRIRQNNISISGLRWPCPMAWSFPFCVLLTKRTWFKLQPKPKNTLAKPKKRNYNPKTGRVIPLPLATWACLVSKLLRPSLTHPMPVFWR
jgi:pyruvate dehydrogenase E2 component (dihydrolipoamide acetyltransferase)